MLKYQWLEFQMDQELSLQSLKRSFPPNVGQVQFIVTQSLQKTLVGLAFALVVTEVAPV
jgi:hypothetical protein